MNKLVSIHYKKLLTKLHIGEHYDFFQNGIIQGLMTLVAALGMVGDMFNALKAVFQREDDFYKQSLASALTSEITALHEKRIAVFNFIWYSASMAKYYNVAAKTLAAEKLLFLRNNYKHLPAASYQDASGIMTNFLEDCLNNEWKPLLELLDLWNLVLLAQDANNAFKVLYRERSVDKETVIEMGKLSEIRADVDSTFDALIETINVAWRTNEMGAKDQTVRASLLEVRRLIDAAVHQAELTLARRGHHKKDDDKDNNGTGTPGGTTPSTPGGSTQNPDTTNPAAPNTPNQNPDTTNPAAPDTPNQNPSGGPHPLDPNEHPSMGEL